MRIQYGWLDVHEDCNCPRCQRVIAAWRQESGANHAFDVKEPVEGCDCVICTALRSIERNRGKHPQLVYQPPKRGLLDRWVSWGRRESQGD